MLCSSTQVTQCSASADSQIRDTCLNIICITNLSVSFRYSLCAALLLYYLEQGLRRVFVTANNCPDRALTAEVRYYVFLTLSMLGNFFQK